jgi:hypothetical protein
MDPDLFHLNWERSFEVLTMIVVISLLLERALSIIFENRIFIAKCKDKGIKEFIAFGVSVAVCWTWDFDAISTILLKEKTTVIGFILTGAIVAGGSKGSIKLFRDLLGFKSSAQAEYEELKSRNLQATAAPVLADPQKAAL